MTRSVLAAESIDDAPAFLGRGLPDAVVGDDLSIEGGRAPSAKWFFTSDRADAGDRIGAIAGLPCTGVELAPAAVHAAGGQDPERWTRDTGATTAFAFAPHGKTLASVSAGTSAIRDWDPSPRLVVLWDVSDGSVRVRLEARDTSPR